MKFCTFYAYFYNLNNILVSEILNSLQGDIITIVSWHNFRDKQLSNKVYFERWRFLSTDAIHVSVDFNASKKNIFPHQIIYHKSQCYRCKLSFTLYLLTHVCLLQWLYIIYLLISPLHSTYCLDSGTGQVPVEYRYGRLIGELLTLL